MRAVDLAGIDHAADRVDLLARVCRAGARARRGGRAVEGHLPGSFAERLERIVGVEGDRRVLARRLVTQADVMVDELSPDPAPLRDVVLAEEVLADIVEHAVADAARRRAALHGGHAIGVVRRPHARVRRSGLPPGRMRHIVAAAVECPDEGEDVHLARPPVRPIPVQGPHAPGDLQATRLPRVSPSHVVLPMVPGVVLTVVFRMARRVVLLVALGMALGCGLGRGLRGESSVGLRRVRLRQTRGCKERGCHDRERHNDTVSTETPPHGGNSWQVAPGGARR